MNFSIDCLDKITDDVFRTFFEYEDAESILFNLRKYFNGSEDEKAINEISVENFIDYMKHRFGIKFKKVCKFVMIK